MGKNQGPSVIQLIIWGKNLLIKTGFAYGQKESELLMAHVLGLPVKSLLMKLKEPVSLEKAHQYRQLVERRAKDYPLQYLTGRQNFMSLDFVVNEQVLIPRWDTEILVEEALRLMEKWPAPLVVDVGTGSGAIGVTLAKYQSKSQIFALDISVAALEVAKENAQRQGVSGRITFLPGEYLNPLIHDPGGKKREFDLLVSNPPYIPQEEIANLPGDVQREPKLALDGGTDGLDCYRVLIPQAKKILKTGGYILLEIAYNQGKAVKEICRNHDFNDLVIFKDFGGQDRVIRGRLN